MASIDIRPELIASRYDGLSVGPRLMYSFETQAGIPVDGGNPLLRNLSPFNLRLVTPTLFNPVRAGVDVGLIGRANVSNEDSQRAANAVRSLFGISGITGSSNGAALATLQQIVSAGQVISGATVQTERAVLADATTAADIAYQVERMLQTSPLTLLVNPNSMGVNYGTVQQYSNRTRYGYIFERWGETQPTISFSGSTGAFIAASNAAALIPGQKASESVSGLQYASKRDSAAWQNFLSLYHFYRNNGYIFDTMGKAEGPLMVGSVAIDYDQWTYLGHIESFEYSYEEGMAHRVEWSMEFTVNRMIDTSQSPVAVLPHVSPQFNPAYPGRRDQNQLARPEGLTGQGDSGRARYVNVSGEEQFAETPLEVLTPTGLL